MPRGTLWMAVIVCVSLMSVVPAAVSGGDVDTGWGTVVLIEYDDAGPAYYPQVAVDDSGNVMAVWQQQDGTRNHIWSNRYVVGVGWGVAELVETEGVASAVNPQVAVDGSGNAVAVWEQVGGIGLDIWSNRYVVGVGWGVAELIESNNSGSAAGPQLAVDVSGNATAVWYQHDGTRYNVWSNRYVVGSGWETATLIETDDAGSADSPQVAVDDSGNAMVVWAQWGGVSISIWSNLYVVGAGWGVAELIEADPPGLARNPQVAADGLGNFIAVWEQWDGVWMSIWSSRYAAGTGWAPAGIIETGSTGDASNPQVAADSSGNAVAVWAQLDGGYCNIWSNRYVVGTGWGAAEIAGIDSTTEIRYTQVGSDRSGNMVAVWERWDGVHMDVWSNRYVVGEGWGTPGLILPDNWGTAINPQVAVDGAGNAVAVWQLYDGLRHNIWSNRYVAPDTTPPTLSLDSPSDGFTTEASSVIVSGTTEPGSALSVNGLFASVGSDGSFSCAVSLVAGANTITVIASDASGNSVTVTISVTYIDPVPALEEELSDAQDEIVALQDDIDTVREELDSTIDELSDVEEELSTVRDELSSTDDELSDARSQNMALMLALVVFVVLTIVMSVMFFSVRRKVGGFGGDAVEKGPPPPDS